MQVTFWNLKFNTTVTKNYLSKIIFEIRIYLFISLPCPIEKKKILRMSLLHRLDSNVTQNS